MILWLGVLCVAWTSFELARLWHASQVGDRSLESALRSAVCPRSGAARGGMKRSRRISAWDERGRPVFVEDLGQP
ncbi:MAG TPA: hypothetical protein ENI85_00510 [Deltaproteobacteria bacterium]|nr:hypothetical protein [Deltaproteobacteria bacterium]